MLSVRETRVAPAMFWRRTGEALPLKSFASNALGE
jgi:hypothetical protein